jgi:hypothetical protein
MSRYSGLNHLPLPPTACAIGCFAAVAPRKGTGRGRAVPQADFAEISFMGIRIREGDFAL